VFVRGSIHARISRAEPAVTTNLLPLSVGQEVMVGPFRTVLRSVSELGGGVLSMTLGVEDDVSRIQKVRVLNSEGKEVNDPRLTHLNPVESDKRTLTVVLKSQTLPKDPVNLEYTYVERPELVRIPFEAQLDIGVTKVGPIEPDQGKAPKNKGARTWPPPPVGPGEGFLLRRPAIDPDAERQPAQPKPGLGESEHATIDLFSLTVGKPAPAEVKEVKWKTAPSPAFYASGFTIARLMLSIPGASILSVPYDGISITRFEDDKGGNLDTTLYREPYSAYAATSPPNARRSPDAQQMLLSLSLASAPTPGATTCTLAGQVQAKVARGERTNSVIVEVRKDQSFRAGPFTGKIEDVRQTAPTDPALRDQGELEVGLSITGPIGRLGTLEFLDNAQTLLNPGHTGPVEPMIRDPADPGLEVTLRRAFRLATAPTGPVTIRFRHYASEENVQVPFEIRTGIGL
jgi:hypothetical protein